MNLALVSTHTLISLQESSTVKEADSTKGEEEDLCKRMTNVKSNVWHSSSLFAFGPLQQSLKSHRPKASVSITGGLVEPDVVSVEQPTIIETEAFGLEESMLMRIDL